MQKRWLLILTIFIGALAACNAQPTLVVPTLIPTSTDAPEPSATVPPTQGPTQEIATFSLPPTWTPEISPTQTPVPATATQQIVATAVQITPLDVCGTFAVDFNRSVTIFPSNTEPVVAWTTVQGAQVYRVTLFGPDNFGNLVELFSGYTADDHYTFTRDLYTFEEGTQYGWEVYPTDNLNQQMCTSRGGELSPFRP
jgi:hypothetical protein